MKAVSRNWAKFQLANIHSAVPTTAPMTADLKRTLVLGMKLSRYQMIKVVTNQGPRLRSISLVKLESGGESIHS